MWKSKLWGRSFCLDGYFSNNQERCTLLSCFAPVLIVCCRVNKTNDLPQICSFSCSATWPWFAQLHHDVHYISALIWSLGNIGSLHTDNETGFTGSRSPIRIQCAVTGAPHSTQAMRIALLDHLWISRTVMEPITQLGSGSRPCGGKVVCGSRSPICIGSGSKIPCGKPRIIKASIICRLWGQTRARISPRPPWPLLALYEFDLDALRPMSTFFTTSWPLCIFVIWPLPQGPKFPHTQKKMKFEARSEQRTYEHTQWDFSDASEWLKSTFCITSERRKIWKSEFLGEWLREVCWRFRVG